MSKLVAKLSSGWPTINNTFNCCGAASSTSRRGRCGLGTRLARRFRQCFPHLTVVVLGLLVSISSTSSVYPTAPATRHPLVRVNGAHRTLSTTEHIRYTRTHTNPIFPICIAGQGTSSKSHLPHTKKLFII